MPQNIDLQIERQYNGVINCIQNSKCNPKSLQTTINNLSRLIKISPNDNYTFFKLALKNNRPDLVIILLKIRQNLNYSDDSDYFDDSDDSYSSKEIKDTTCSNIFKNICTKKSSYLNDFLNSNWINKVDIKEIYDILMKRINYGLISRANDLLTEYQKEDLLLNQHLKNAQEKIIIHKKGADILLNIEKLFVINKERSNYWHSVNPELKRRKEIRTKARWTLIFFFCKYVKPGIHNWLWMPGGYMFKKGERNWNNFYGIK
jgi:hypothetical protein